MLLGAINNALDYMIQLCQFLFLNTEIIKEVKTNGYNLTQLLQVPSDQLEPNCLNQALEAAVNNDNHVNIGKLILKGADNIEDCLRQSRDHHKPHARAMLLLVKAAIQGDRNLVLKLFGESVPEMDTQEYQDDSFKDAQKALVAGEISAVVPIEITCDRNLVLKLLDELVPEMDIQKYLDFLDKYKAKIKYLDDGDDFLDESLDDGDDFLDESLDDDDFLDEYKAKISKKIFMLVPLRIAHRNGYTQVLEELLLRTDVNMEEGTVYWHGLQLLVFDVSWLKRIYWVKTLQLARNGFKQLPDGMGMYLKQVSIVLWLTTQEICYKDLAVLELH